VDIGHEDARILGFVGGVGEYVGEQEIAAWAMICLDIVMEKKSK